MTVGFLLKIAAIERELTVKETLRTLKHLVRRVQSTITLYSSLDFLYLVVPAILWGSTEPKLTQHHRCSPGTIPSIYRPRIIVLQNLTIRDKWQAAGKKIKNRKKGLLSVFSSFYQTSTSLATQRS